MAKSKYLVPMSSPEIDDSDRQAVQEVLQTTSLSIGPRVVAFEEAVCAYSGARFAAAVSAASVARARAPSPSRDSRRK